MKIDENAKAISTTEPCFVFFYNEESDFINIIKQNRDPAILMLIPRDDEKNEKKNYLSTREFAKILKGE